MLEDGSKTNFILNTLNMVDISVWDNSKIELLLEKFTNFGGSYMGSNGHNELAIFTVC